VPEALQVLDRPGRRSMLIVPGSIWVSFAFRVTSRDDASDPWTRDYLYGENTRWT
jgi:hypothetical protein